MKIPAGDKACPLCGWTDFTEVKREGKRAVLSCARCSLGWTYPPCDSEDYAAGYFGKDVDPRTARQQKHCDGCSTRMVLKWIPSNSCR